MKMKEYKVTPEYFDEYQKDTIYSHNLEKFIKDNSIKVPFKIQCGAFPEGLWVGDVNEQMGRCDCCLEFYSIRGNISIFELVEE